MASPNRRRRAADDGYAAEWRDANGVVTSERAGLDLEGAIAVARRALEADMTI